MSNRQGNFRNRTVTVVRQLYNLVTVQLKEFFRETGAVFWALLFPIIMSWVLGIAFTAKTEITRTAAIVKTDSGAPACAPIEERTSGSLTFTEKYTGRVKFIYMTRADAVLALKRGRILLFIECGPEGPVYSFDPQNSEALLLQTGISSFLRGEEKPVEEIRPLSAAGTRYIDFLIPGILAMQIMNSCMWGIGWALIEWRIKKLMRRMYATPMKRSTFMAAQFITRLLLSSIESLSLIIFALLMFNVQVQGSVSALILLIICGNIAFGGIALLISSRTSNSRTGNGLLNAVTMPMMILSGIFFSYHNFPDWAVSVISRLPLTVLADSVRAVFIEGAGLAASLPAAGIMTGFGLLCTFIALKVYRWY